MEVNAEQLLVNAMKDGIREGIKSKLTQGYSNPFDKAISDELQSHGGTIRQMLSDAINSCVGDPEFREQIATAVRASLAKTLVAKFGGELEKQVNALKSDPTTRARITVAIADIIKERSAAV